MTFRLRDARTGADVEVRPRTRGLLRLSVAGGPREVVVADLVRRLGGRVGWQAQLTRLVPSGADRRALHRESLDLGAAPPDEYAGSAGFADADPVDVHVGAGTPEAGVVLTVGELHGDADLDADGVDPTAVRLALLDHPYAGPATVDAAATAAAGETLRGWRALIGRWGHAPGKPMCAEVLANLDAALSADLDTPRALDVLRALAAEPELPDGSKLETFLYADRVLGLDLPAGLAQG